MAKKQDENKQQSFAIAHQYIKDLSFENLLTAKEMLEENFEPTGEIQLNLEADEVAKDVNEITLKIRVEAKDQQKKKSVYIVELEYSAVIVTEGFSDDEKVPLLMVETPRLMFPYAREIISSATGNGGFLPLQLKPVDFLGLFMQQAEQAQQQ